MLDTKLNLKDGHTIAVINSPYDVEVAAPRAASETADAVLLFAANRAELDRDVHVLVRASERGALAWLAYPKAKKLNTDLNRDIIHDYMPSMGLDAIRQIAIDETWSALRFKPLK